MRTPETLTAVERHAALQRISNQESTKDAGGVTSGSIMPGTGTNEKMSETNKKPSASAQEKRLSAARQAMSAELPRNATAGIDPMDEADGSVTLLSPFDIDPYAKNPRTRPNPKRAEIKASMMAEGRITNTITVTRRSPNDKYTPYGGGNTRIQIAQELLKEDDQRFAQITVITVKWPGEAAVISAHLSENDNRGDISFWERAQGVVSFKKTFEEENNTVLSSAELNNALKKRGLNYGIRMIQNFAFAVEHLQLIGNWLRTKDVNETIRPRVSTIFELSNHFDKAKDVKRAIEEILLMHCQDLESTEAANLEQDPAERVEVKIDLQSLLTDIHSVSAKVLGIQVDDMPAVLQAFHNDPKLSAEDLRKIKIGGETANTPATGAGKQSPLGRMLGTVAANRNSKEKHSQTPETGSNNDAEQARLTEFTKRLTAEFMALNEVTPIADFMVLDQEMPLGFLVDIPESMQYFQGKQLTYEQASFRENVWPILAMLSGQCNRDVIIKCTAPSKWQKAIASGSQSMTDLCVSQGIGMRKGIIYIHSMQMWQALGSSAGGAELLRIISTITDFYFVYPEKITMPYTSLFDN